MNDEILEKIESFILQERGKYKFPLKRETSLENDLKITGDDAWEFMEKFAEIFNVDISKLDLNLYFASEGSWSLNLLVLFGKHTTNKQITLGDLELSVIKGELFISNGSVSNV